MGHKQLKAAAKPIQELCGRERGGPTRGQLNGKRQTLETTHELSYIASVRVIDEEIRIATLGALEEKTDCTDLEQLFGAIGLILARQRKCWNAPYKLAWNPQTLARSRQHGKSGADAQQPGNHGCGVVDQVLAVVQHKHHVPCDHGCLDHCERAGHASIRQLQRAYDRAWDQLSIRNRSKLDQPDAVSEVTAQSLGQLQREPRLANARRTHERAETRLQDDPRELCHLAIPIDEWRQLRRQIVPSLASRCA